MSTDPRTIVTCGSATSGSVSSPVSGAPLESASGTPSPLVSIATISVPSGPTIVSGMPSPLVSTPRIVFPSTSVKVSGMPSPLVSTPITTLPLASRKASTTPSPSVSMPTSCVEVVPSSRFDHHSATPPIAPSQSATTVTAATTMRRRCANSGRWTYAAVVVVVAARPRAVISTLCCVASPDQCLGPLSCAFATSRWPGDSHTIEGVNATRTSGASPVSSSSTGWSSLLVTSRWKLARLRARIVDGWGTNSTRATEAIDNVNGVSAARSFARLDVASKAAACWPMPSERGTATSTSATDESPACTRMRTAAGRPSRSVMASGSSPTTATVYTASEGPSLWMRTRPRTTSPGAAATSGVSAISRKLTVLPARCRGPGGPHPERCAPPPSRARYCSHFRWRARRRRSSPAHSTGRTRSCRCRRWWFRGTR